MKEIMKKHKEKEKAERRKKIERSRHNNIYKNITTKVTSICEEGRIEAL